MSCSGFRRHLSDVGLSNALLYVGGKMVVGKGHQEEAVALPTPLGSTAFTIDIGHKGCHLTTGEGSEAFATTQFLDSRRYQSSLGANNDQAELHISSDERFVVSNSTTGPSLIDSRRQAFSLR